MNLRSVRHLGVYTSDDRPQTTASPQGPDAYNTYYPSWITVTG